MKAINPNEIKDNFIELIGKEWMLVSAGDKAVSYTHLTLPTKA